MNQTSPIASRHRLSRSTAPVSIVCLAAVLLVTAAVPCHAQVAVRGQLVYTMTGPPIEDGIVVVKEGKISAIGAAADIQVPDGFRVLEASVVTPGLIDAHSVVGLGGILNQTQDQDQLERSKPIQPALRAMDAYHPADGLVDWVRSFGVTTVHTGHAPGELISGQTFIAKTTGNTADEAAIVDARAVTVTLNSSAQKQGSQSPGTRGKMMAMLREQFIKARDYLKKQRAAHDDDDDEDEDEDEDEPATPATRDLNLEALGKVLNGELALLVTAHKAQDIAGALRLGEEFDIDIWLDGGAEAYLLVDKIKAAGIPVIVHPTMQRAVRDSENLSFETAATLADAGIPVALQSGYESYVPKTRVVLFEAAQAAANKLGFERALASITIDAARILGIDDRVGSLEVGKDGDLALYDGDPFEWTSHCVGVVIEGDVVSDTER